MRKVQMILLIVLTVCSGISLSSGLYYEINGMVYLLPIFPCIGIYYLARYVFRDYKWRSMCSLEITLGFCVLGNWILWKQIGKGFADLMNTVSSRVKYSYHIDLGTWKNGDKDFVVLVVCSLLSIVIAVSIYLYDTERPSYIQLLPTLLLFSVSIAADGVPNAACFIVYSAAFIIYLGMGRTGGSFKNFALLASCTLAVLIISITAFSWDQVDSFMRDYRGYFVETVGRVQPAPRESKRKKDPQTIDFGQFNQAGDIYYTGTVEMTVKSEKQFNSQELFLRGFVGTYYDSATNLWEREQFYYLEDENLGSLFGNPKGLTITPVYDQGEYQAFAVDDEELAKLLERKCDAEAKPLNRYGREVEEVIDDELNARINQEIIKGQQFSTYKEAIDFVNRYLAYNCAYTLHPGPLQEGVSEVSRFLFDTKKGYCTHFSTAAVMIFRSMGIRARIAQGYMVSGLKLRPNAVVNVYDSNAHAWVEVYIPSSKKMEGGWVPVDVTPYSNQVAQNEGTAGESEEEVEERGETEPKMEPVPVPQETEEPEKPGNEETEEKGTKEGKKDKKDKKDKKEAAMPSSATATPGDLGEGTGAEQEKARWINRELAVRLGIGTAVCILAGAVFVLLVQRREREQRRRWREGRFYQLNEELQKAWDVLGIPWDYMDSRKMAEKIFLATGAFYEEPEEELRKEISSYVMCVYLSRYDSMDLTREERKCCISYLLRLFEQIQKQESKKLWRKIKRIRVVKFIQSE